MYAWPVPLLDGAQCKDHVDEDVEEAYTYVSSVAILECTGTTKTGPCGSPHACDLSDVRCGRTKTFALDH